MLTWACLLTAMSCSTVAISRHRVWYILAVHVLLVDQDLFVGSLGNLSIVALGAPIAYTGDAYSWHVDRTWLLCCSGVSITVHAVASYAVVYMLYEHSLMVFMAQLSWFMASMLWYTSTVSVIHLVLLWEMLGLLSYLLIQHWGSRTLAALASAKSMLSNKVLDALVLVATSSMWALGVHDTTTLTASASSSTMADVMVLGMVSVKCVLLGLHGWLPDAMEGPTAVSAVIHAATLVVAGVVMVLRVTVILWMEHQVLWLWSCAVSCYSGISYACTDAKRVVAYSTAWHVGVMAILSITHAGSSALHLVAHAVLKASMFMVMGTMLHVHAQQDSRSIQGVVCSSTQHALLVWALYHSTGWLYTATWTTKKVLLDSSWASGTTSWWSLLHGVLLIAVLLSVGYTVLILTVSISGVATGRWHQQDALSCYSWAPALVAYSTVLGWSTSPLVLPLAVPQYGIHHLEGVHLTCCYLGWWYAAQVLSMTMIMVIAASATLSTSLRSLTGWVSWDTSMARTTVITAYMLTCSGMLLLHPTVHVITQSISSGVLPVMGILLLAVSISA
uniref:NADH dehydrogenase subunit 5 n=1 Tax=Diplonema papillatum TaxID=91374 RepID=A0A1L6C3Z3_9EUGL|nr:NADH dehydrogenase subunit 5 [Diplonema papillatum]